MTRLIDNLEKQGLVVRSADPKDRRINIIRLTEKGSGLEEITQSLVVSTMEDALSVLTEEELASAGIMLNKVFHNIKNSLAD